MPRPGNLHPSLVMDDVWEVEGLYSVATGALTKVYGKGITSIAHPATGKYTLTFQDVGGTLLDLYCAVQRAAGDETLCARYTKGSFSRSAKTAAVEIYEIDETKALVDPADTDYVYFRARFLQTAV